MKNTLLRFLATAICFCARLGIQPIVGSRSRPL